MQDEPKHGPLPAIGTVATFNWVSEERGWGLQVVRGPLHGMDQQGWQLREVATDDVVGSHAAGDSEAQVAAWAVYWATARQK